MEASRTLCEQAQSCFSFVDREALADATADVYAAVRAVLAVLRVYRVCIMIGGGLFFCRRRRRRWRCFS